MTETDELKELQRKKKQAIRALNGAIETKDQTAERRFRTRVAELEHEIRKVKGEI